MPEEVAQLINECLSYDPKDRPSAKQIYDRLQATPGPASVRPRASASEASSSTGAANIAAAGSTAASATSVAGATSAAAPPLPIIGQGDSAPMPGDQHKCTAAEPPQKMPTPLGRTRLPIKSAFAIDE